MMGTDICRSLIESKGKIVINRSHLTTLDAA